jgi:hypothetical protein
VVVVTIFCSVDFAIWLSCLWVHLQRPKEKNYCQKKPHSALPLAIGGLSFHQHIFDSQVIPQITCIEGEAFLIAISDDITGLSLAWWPSVAMEYVIRFAQVHETFRQPEIQALASLAGIDLKIVYYNPWVCVLDLIYYLSSILQPIFAAFYILYKQRGKSKLSPRFSPHFNIYSSHNRQDTQIN